MRGRKSQVRGGSRADPYSCCHSECCQRGLLALLGKQMVGKPARRFDPFTLRQFPPLTGLVKPCSDIGQSTKRLAFDSPRQQRSWSSQPEAKAGDDGESGAKQGSIPCTRYLFAVFRNPPVLPGNAETILVWSFSRLEIAASSTGGCRRRERSISHKGGTICN